MNLIFIKFTAFLIVISICFQNQVSCANSLLQNDSQESQEAEVSLKNKIF